jgi:hypothetical protein
MYAMIVSLAVSRSSGRSQYGDLLLDNGDGSGAVVARTRGPQ